MLPDRVVVDVVTLVLAWYPHLPMAVGRDSRGIVGLKE